MASAQDASSKLDAWLMENALGPHATGQENWEGIVAAAKEEGEVSVYTASGRIAKLVDHFQALYPGITLTVYDLGSVKTIEKTVREQDAGIFTADVVTTGNSGQVIHELLGKHRIFNYVPAHFVDRIPLENREPLLIRVNEAMTFFYNAESNPNGSPISNVCGNLRKRNIGVAWALKTLCRQDPHSWDWQPWCKIQNKWLRLTNA